MRTRLLIASATTAALLAGAALAQSSPSTGDTAVNPPSSNQLPAGVATGNAAINPPTPSGQAGSGDVTAPAATSPGSTLSDTASVAPAAGAPTERAPSASAGVDVISNGPVPDTRANRAKYGAPLSNAGRLTRPAGN
jgi:hypothetical protein